LRGLLSWRRVESMRSARRRGSAGFRNERREKFVEFY
jgi:hypothetical protein